jgi:peptide deformylase
VTGLQKLSIIHHPHPTLRVKARPLARVDAQLRHLADEMLDLMYEAKGVGLAATQVNLPIRMFVANPAGERNGGEEFVLLNPELQLPKGSETSQEGCLSLPGIYGDVKRPKQVRLSAYDISGNPVERTVDGYLARIMQHENDHLDGILFFDRMSEDARGEIEDEIQEMVRVFKARQIAGDIASDEGLAADLKPWYEKYA